jgi:BolA protein
VRIVSEAFSGKSLMERHRMVYALLEGKIGTTVHALALETRAPGE